MNPGRRRRAAMLLGLALLLGGLAASDVHRRQAAVEAQLAPLVDVVIARDDLQAGRRLRLGDLGVRRMPARFAPAGAAAQPGELVGQRVAVPVPAGGFLAAGQLDVQAAGPPGSDVRRGERAAEIVGAGSPELVRPGVRVDVLVTRGGGGEGTGRTELALEDVEVLAATPAPADPSEQDPGVARVAATLRVTLRQAVYLAAAQDFARRVRLLARAPGDRHRVGRTEVAG
jgi:pilus assembly protein CpaB